MADDFWQSLWTKIRPDVESFLVEMTAYVLVLSGLVILFLFFKLLLALGIEQWYVDLLEFWEHIGVAVGFLAALLGVIRRAIIAIILSWKGSYGKPTGKIAKVRSR